jgi:hypothetical protein
MIMVVSFLVVNGRAGAGVADGWFLALPVAGRP